MDPWSLMQQNIMPTVDETFVGFKIEMLLKMMLLMAQGTLIGEMVLLILYNQ